MEKRIEELENRIILNPKDISALRALGNIYSDELSDFYDKQKYEEILRRIIRIDPDDIDATTSLTILESQNGLADLDIDYDTARSGRVVVSSSADAVITKDVMDYIRKPRYFSIIIFAVNILIILAILSITFVRPFVFGVRDRQIADMNTSPSDVIVIEVSPMSEFDGLKKTDIIRQRGRQVEKSMFNSVEYAPSNWVFGGIKDGKPWIGADNFVCHDDSAPGIIKNGDSAVSRLVNNPSMLIGVNPVKSWNFSSKKYNRNDYPVCKNRRILFEPARITYSPAYNLITAEINIDPVIVDSNRLIFTFLGLNARDLGYNYGYVYNYTNIRFENPNNISTGLYEFADYIGLGQSCGIPGGCNNICPMQDRLFFLFGDENYHSISSGRAIVDFKLWKERPRSVNSRPDIYYRIIFRMRQYYKPSA